MLARDVDADKPPKAVAIRITHPNSCSLKYDELDLKLRDMLNASGIEPKPMQLKRQKQLRHDAASRADRIARARGRAERCGGVGQR